MAGQAPESLRVLICALDIIFLFIFLTATYLPYICRSWSYKKGIITRRDLWIATTILAISAVRTAGSLLWIVNNFRDREDRHTLSLRVMLALTTSPIDGKVTRWAFKTCKWATRIQASQETGPQQPFPYTGPTTPIPRSRQVLAAINPHRNSRPDKSFRHCCWIFMCWFVPFLIFIEVALFAGIGLSKTSRRDGDWAAIVIWVLPPTLPILDQCWYYLWRRRRRPEMVETGPSRVNPPTAVPTIWHLGAWNSWMVGTMVGAVAFLIVFAMDWESRKESVSDMTEFWNQLAEALTGCGG
ncbi:hypothetical protein ACHAPT_003219 [Fusarium lateritium]